MESTTSDAALVDALSRLSFALVLMESDGRTLRASAVIRPILGNGDFAAGNDADHRSLIESTGPAALLCLAVGNGDDRRFRLMRQVPPRRCSAISACAVRPNSFA